MIEYGCIKVFHKAGIIIGIFLLTRDAKKNCRCIYCFGQCPVHPVMDDRLTGPISRIYDSGSPVGIPCIRHGPVIEPAGMCVIVLPVVLR